MSSFRFFASRALSKPRLVTGSSIQPAETALSRRISQTAISKASSWLRPRIPDSERAQADLRNSRAEPSTSHPSGPRKHSVSHQSNRGEPSRNARDGEGKFPKKRFEQDLREPARAWKPRGANEAEWKPVRAVLAHNKPLKKRYGEIEIFHNPENPLSCKILDLLVSANTNSFPPRSERSSQPKPIKRRQRGDPTHIMPPPPPPPLEYHLKVNTTIPRPLQLRQLMTMMAAQAPSYTKAFLKPSRASYDLNPTNEDELVALATKDTSIIAWPIVVNWATGWCSVGNYKEVYRFLRKIAESRPLPKLEGTPIWDNDTLAKERVRGPTYLSGTLSDQDIEELEDITS